ncbi:hypothetical protein [Actinoallomurus iriomotensis]|uniref:hypothetical protein n=1 Tax=Actinoallomurus iriomotensis TaxID=478107 RepID=UPI0025525343|nr:hypothetical protein [Actinoallomurus iriomotensis]
MISDEAPAEQERRIVSATRTGALVDLSVGDAEHDDPANGALWDGTRTVRAELLIELLTAEGTSGRPRAIKVRGARIVGPLDLEACELACPLLLRDCYIDDPINLDEATAPAIRLPGCHLQGLSAKRVRVLGNLEFNDGFLAGGEVSLLSARIGGALWLSGLLTNPGGVALSAGGITVDQDMVCVPGFAAKGEVDLSGARIGGQLDLSGAQLINPDGRALHADGLRVEQGMYCSDGFTARGEVSLLGADIGGPLVLAGARLANPGRPALNADRIGVGQGMFCSDRFSAEGEISLIGAHIGGDLVLSGARLANPGGPALTADQLTVDHGMDCSEFTARGEVRLVGAHIGEFDLHNADLTEPGEYALAADQISIARNMDCSKLFTAGGEVRLRGANVGGQLTLFRAALNNRKGKALDLRSARVAELGLRDASCEGIIDLTNARVGAFDDDQANWPPILRLRGFTYQTLENDQVSVHDRLRWLTRHPGGYTPQIYDQLADAYRRAGNAEAARKVGVAKQRRRRSALNPLNWLLYVTIGYGYRTWLAAVWLAGLAALGWWVFGRAYPQHMTRATPNAPGFHALAYTLDVLLPIVDLGQEKAWTPNGWAEYWTWSLIAVGWVLTTAAVAGLTGIFKRD